MQLPCMHIAYLSLSSLVLLDRDTQGKNVLAIFPQCNVNNAPQCVPAWGSDRPAALGGWAGYIWAEKRANTFGQQLPALSLYLLHIYQGRNTFSMKSEILYEAQGHLKPFWNTQDHRPLCYLVG